MTTYTKQTIMTYQEPVDMVTPNYMTGMSTKTSQMVTDGKTDGNYEFIDEWTVRRVWLDQNAADEWTQFIQSLAETENIIVTNYQTSDNIPTV
jgi:hypothetical protein